MGVSHGPKDILDKDNLLATSPLQWALVVGRRSLPLDLGENNPQAMNPPQWAVVTGRKILNKDNLLATSPLQWALVAGRRSLPLDLGENNLQVTEPPQWALVTSRGTSWAKVIRWRQASSNGLVAAEEHCPLTLAKATPADLAAKGELQLDSFSTPPPKPLRQTGEVT